MGRKVLTDCHGNRLPDLLRNLRDEFQLALLHVLIGQVRADENLGESALRGQAEPVLADVARRLVHPRCQLLRRLKLGGLA
jgi:hypothetical protein